MGARREATEVADCLTTAISESSDSQESAGTRVTSLISGPNPGDPEPDATTVLNAGFEKAWRIIHIAGHGEAPREIEEKGKEKRIEYRGVVLSEGCFLGPEEIEALRVKPELVFVNCCHLAADDPSGRLKTPDYNRAQFAAGVAQALIKSGVRCVIAAGWAVDDHAASIFATTFYGALLKGRRFIDAVAAARERAYACGGNTWAAYQCYGDPDWQFNPAGGDAQRPTLPLPGQEFASIASAPSLIVALEQIATKSEYRSEKSDAQAARLHYLEDTFARHWESRGDVAEAFGKAWSKTDRFAEAIDWYERARQAQDGTASLAAIEQLANLRVRKAWNGIKNKDARSPEAIDQAREQIRDAMKLLDTLQAVSPTYERENIYGSGFKRLAMLEAAAGRDEDERQAIAQMLEHYGAAEAIARETGVRPIFYPAMNRIAAQLALAADAQPLDEADVAAVRKSMQSVSPDFWSVVGQTELKVFASMAAGQLSQDLVGLIADFGKHHERVSNSWMWSSVLDTATFVSSRYRRLANESEQAAADKLLGELESLLPRTPPAPVNESGDKEKSAHKSRTRAAKPAAKKKRRRQNEGKEEKAP